MLLLLPWNTRSNRYRSVDDRKSGSATEARRLLPVRPNTGIATRLLLYYDCIAIHLYIDL